MGKLSAAALRQFWYVKCECGWQVDDCESREVAGVALAEHRAAFFPATGKAWMTVEVEYDPAKTKWTRGRTSPQPV